MNIFWLILSIFVFSLFELSRSTSRKFPHDFLFGVASAAYQIEGGYDSRGETVFDYYQRLDPTFVTNSSDAKIACNSYNLYEEDLKMLDFLGVDFYRFSIAWTRILPTGYSDKINADGIRYYNNLIDGLLAKNIKPIVTIFHYDLPKPLQDLGGWTNPILSDFYEDYARILFENFGDRVKFWITFNANYWGCGDSEWPPMLNQSGIGEYLCLKTTLLAHAKAYHLYHNDFVNQKGQIGFVVDGRWYDPASDSAEDLQATERVREFNIGLMANPIYGDGDFPKIVKERVEDLSLKGGFSKSRLPKLTSDEINTIKGSFDFIGLNVYTSFLIKNDATTTESKFYSYDKDVGMTMYQHPNWESALSPWLKIVPSGMRSVLKWVKDKYNNPPIFVTENGFSDGGELDDFGRIHYYQLYLKALLEAIHEDGVNVKGYAAWSLMDNFEWLAGYSEKFGLFHVDFNDPDRKRTPKASAKWYKNLIKRRELDDSTKTEL